jgi:hypothetical protein
VHLAQDRAGLPQTVEESRAAPTAWDQRHALSGGERARPIGEVLGAEQIAAERTGEKLFGALQRAAEQAVERWR